MKTAFLILSLLLFLLLAVQASGSFWFQVIDISPINLTPNSEADFTVAVKGLGSQGSYVALVFKNMSQGLDISCSKQIKYVLPAGVTKYNCTIKAGDIVPGNYSFVVDVAASGSPSGKKTAFVQVLPTRPAQEKGPQQEELQEATQADKANQTSASPPAKHHPPLAQP